MDPLNVAPVLPGETLAGKYRVERVLGKGGMGIVVAARHLELEQRVAIKFLLGERAEFSTERFLREARAAAQVKSEHVCRVHDVARLESGEPYIVMEYLEGTDLAQKLKREGPLSVSTAATCVIEACAALSEAHAQRIVHRDLKPANLFLAERANGTTCIKVLDFGISKLPDLNDMTATSTMMGSPLYMSPEQIASSRDVDARADIWSLGVILHELVSGEPPFAADTMIQLSVKVREEPAPSLSASVKGISPEFDAVVAKCLAKKPTDRYESAAELAGALAPFAGEDGAHLAARLMRMHAADPALRPTKHGQTPPASMRSGEVRDEPPASREGAALGVTPVSAPLAGQVTFAPLNTTAARVAKGKSTSRWLLALAASALAGAALFAVRGRTGDGDAPTSATASTASATLSPSTTTMTPEAPSVAPPASASPKDAPRTTTSASAPNTVLPREATRPPPRALAARAAAPSTASAPTAEAPSAPTAGATATTPTATQPAPPETTGRRKRPLDRSDPF